MNTQYKSKDGRYTTTFEWQDQKELFKKIAKFQEIFEANNEHCGVAVLLNVRTHEGNDFFEKKCPKCGKSFSYGQKKVGGELFPHYKEGWTKWTPPGEAGEVEENPFDGPTQSKTAVTVVKPPAAKSGKTK